MSTLADFRECIENLSTILKDESQILKKGDIFKLDNIHRKKAALTRDVETHLNRLTDQDKIASRGDIMRIKRLADENGLILKSVMNGLKAASIRLENLRQAEAKVGAYNAKGTGLTISEDRIVSEKRV